MEFSSVFETTILHYITLYDRMTQQPPQYLSVFPLNLRPLCSFLSLTFGLVKKKEKKKEEERFLETVIYVFIGEKRFILYFLKALKLAGVYRTDRRG